MSKVTKLPLWERLIERMEEEGRLKEGEVFPLAFFEEGLDEPIVKDNLPNPKFAFAMLSLKGALEDNQNIYLEQEKQTWRIIYRNEHWRILRRRRMARRRSARKSVSFGSGTSLDGMTEVEKRRHMKELENAGIDALSLANSKKIEALLFDGKEKKKLK